MTYFSIESGGLVARRFPSGQSALRTLEVALTTSYFQTSINCFAYSAVSHVLLSHTLPLRLTTNSITTEMSNSKIHKTHVHLCGFSFYHLPWVVFVKLSNIACFSRAHRSLCLKLPLFCLCHRQQTRLCG